MLYCIYADTKQANRYINTINSPSMGYNPNLGSRTGTYLFGFFLCLATAAATLEEQDYSISRLNYGCHFSFKAAVKSVSEIWYHTFRITLPNDDWLMAERPPKYVIDTCNSRVTNGNNAHCLLFNKNAQLLSDIQVRGSKQLHKLMRSIHSIIPQPRVTRQPGARSQRGLLPFVGHVFKGLFGLATENDLAAIRTVVNQISASQNHELRVFKDTQKHLSSFIDTTNSRLNNLAEIVKNTSLEAIHLQEMESTTFRVYMEYQNNVTVTVQRIQWDITSLIEEYSNVLAAMEILLSGFIPSYFISQDILASTINQIKQELLMTGNKLTLIHDTAGWYYSSATFVYVVRNTELFITVQMPLTSFLEDFYVYSIQTYPLALQQGQNHLMIINNLPAGLAIQPSRNHYYEMTQAQIDEVTTHHFSKPQKIYTMGRTQSCLTALLADNKIAVDESCEYTVVPKALQTGIYHLKDSTYLMINVRNYTLHCVNESVTRFDGCQSCVLSLPRDCSWSDGARFIPRSMTETAHARRSGLKHITNLGLLIKFFDNATLALINGDTLLDQPPKLLLPDFKFYEHELQKTFAKQTQDQLALEQVAIAAKADKLIVASLTESVLTTGADLPWYTFWTSFEGIILVAVTVLTVLLVMNTLYLNLKVRQIAVTLLVLNDHLTKVDGQINPTELDYFKQQAAKALITLNASLPMKDPTIFIQTTVTLWPQIIATMLACILLSIALYKCYRKRNPNYLKQCSTQLLLELDGHKRNLLIYLTEIRGHPQDYQVTAVDYISHLNQAGDIRPFIQYY